MLRIKIANFTVILIFLFLILNLFNHQLIGGKRFRDLSYKNCIRLLPQEGSRGRILDRNDNVIVDNTLSYNVMIMPGDIKQLDRTLMRISQVLGVSLNTLKNKFKVNFTTSFSPIEVAKNIDIKKAIALEELKFESSGIIVQPQPQRLYPYGRLASHVIGYLGEIDRWRLTKLVDYGYKTKDMVGFGGLEEKYDYYLRQEEGGLSVEVDHQGKFVRVLGFRPPKNGEDIKLSLDLRIQKIAEENLERKIGCVIIMDPYTGEIIAMANWPNFYPYSIRDVLNKPDAPLLNRSISGIYPAGSVFKLVLASAGLETNKIDLSRRFFCSGSTHIGREEFSCWNTHNDENLLDAITHSCNIFFYKTGLLLGGQLIHTYAIKFGFSKATSVDLPYEASGFVPSPLWKKLHRFKNWLDGDTVNLSIGQAELLVTPLQITRMMAVFANRGFLVTPYTAKAIGGKSILNYQKKVVQLAIKENTINYIRQSLRNVVSDPNGTANLLADLSVAVAGKTGTAQAPFGQPHGWFTGFFPYKTPRFVITVFLERGGSGYYATQLAKQIIEAMIKEGLI